MKFIKTLFKKKLIAIPEKVLPWFHQLACDVQKAYPIGYQMDYLGIKMIVIGYVEYRQSICDPYCGFYRPEIRPRLITEYADNMGVIQSKEFELPFFETLLQLKGLR